MTFLLALAAYLAIWPVPVEPVRWQAPPAPGYTGAHAANARLAGLHAIALHGEAGPEHVLAAADGTLYVSVASGHILRMAPDGSGQQVFADTGGRPLGLAMDADGALLVADAYKGLLRISPQGAVSVLADARGDTPVRFVDGVTVARSGRVYFTDASQRFTPAQWDGTMQAAMLDVFEQSATGRVLEYDPASRAVRVVATGLSFANGIVLSADEGSLFVAESGRYRVWKIAVDAAALDVANAGGRAAVVLGNLPGYPDNLTRAPDGKLWLGLAGPRNGLDAMARHPFLRKVALRVPRSLWPEPRPYGHVLAFTEDGTVVEDMQDPGGTSPVTTGATETARRIYIHNVTGTSLGWRER